MKKDQISVFLGKVVSFNNSLKLHHWLVTGEASYSKHIYLDQAVDSLVETTDRLVEISLALKGDLDIVVPETKNPANITKHVEDFFGYVEDFREKLNEALLNTILDDYQEALQQLLYRLQRLQ